MATHYSYEELQKYSDDELRETVMNYKDAEGKRQDILIQIDALRRMQSRTKIEEEELSNLMEKLDTATKDINLTYKPEREIADKILGERAVQKFKAIQERKTAPSATTASALVASILASVASKQKSSSDLYQKYSAKPTEDLIKQLNTIEKRKTNLIKLNDKVNQEKSVYKAKHGTDPDPNDKRTNYSKSLMAYNGLYEIAKDDQMRKSVLEQIIQDRGNVPPPEQNPELPTSSQYVEEDIRTEIGSSGLTREQLQALQKQSEDQLLKGKERVEGAIDDIKPDVARYDILKQIPETLKTEEIKSELEKQKSKVLDMEKLQAVYNSYKSELERRGIQEESTQTEYNKIILEEAKKLLDKYPELNEEISKILVSELIKKGTVSIKDIDTIKQLSIEQKPYFEKSYTYLKPPEKIAPLKTNIKYNVLPLPSVYKTYTYWD
jgi:hypothetical protein